MIGTAGSDANINLTFTPKGTGSSIFSAGNVGIGTIAPPSKLVVSAGDAGYYPGNSTSAPLGTYVGSNPEVLIADNSNTSGRTATLRFGTIHTTYYLDNPYIQAIQGSGVDRYDMAFGAGQGATASEKMRITAVGNIGIGTTTPTQKLQVISSAVDLGSTQAGNVGNGRIMYAPTSPVSVRQEFGTDGTGWQYRVAQNNAGTVTDLFTVVTGGNIGIGTVTPNGPLDIYSNLGSKFRIATFTDNSADDPQIQTFIGKATRPSYSFLGGAGFYNVGMFAPSANTIAFSNNNLERMRIDSAGNVGIGTSAPAQLLDISAGAGGTSLINFSAGSGTNGAQVGFKAGYGAVVGATSGNATYIQGSSLYFTNQGLSTTFMSILNSGNVGIGTTSPSQKLDVNGSLNLSGNILSVGDSVGPVNVGFRSDKSWGLYAGSGNLYLKQSTDGAISYFYFGNNSSVYNSGINMLTGGAFFNGNVGIGTTTPGYKLDVQGGDINASGSVRSATVALTSDIRFKKDIKNLDNSLDKILNLRGVSYNWRVDQFPERKFNDRHQIGVIAQEVEEKFPELVDTDNNGYKSVNYPALVAPLIEALKSFYSEFKGSTSRIALLETNEASKDRSIASLAVTTKVLSEKVKEIDDLKAKNEKLTDKVKEIDELKSENAKEVAELKDKNKALEERLNHLEKALNAK